MAIVKSDLSAILAEVGIIVLAPAAAAVSDAASAEQTAIDKWVKAAKAMFKCGFRVEMLDKGTEDAPNPAFVAAARDTILGLIVQGVSASKKAQRYDTPRPDAEGADVLSGAKTAHMWTVADMCNLSTEQLRSIDDDQLKSTRRDHMKNITGPIFTRFKKHLDNVQNPDKAKGVKAKAKADAGATVEGGFDLRTREGFLGAVNGGTAGLAHWCGSAHRDALDNAARQLIELLTAAK